VSWKNPSEIGFPSNLFCEFILSHLKRSFLQRGSNRGPLGRDFTKRTLYHCTSRPRQQKGLFNGKIGGNSGKGQRKNWEILFVCLEREKTKKVYFIGKIGGNSGKGQRRNWKILFDCFEREKTKKVYLMAKLAVRAAKGKEKIGKFCLFVLREKKQKRFI
jgi:hypothetical protein